MEEESKVVAVRPKAERDVFIVDYGAKVGAPFLNAGETSAPERWITSPATEQKSLFKRHIVHNKKGKEVVLYISHEDDLEAVIERMRGQFVLPT